MTKFRYTISAQGESAKMSNTWSNAVNAAIALAKEFKSSVITIKDVRGIENASFVFDNDNQIIPA